MSPASDLSVLLKTLEPVLNPGVFVFASVEDRSVLASHYTASFRCRRFPAPVVIGGCAMS
ncbi:ACT domain-containing protein [Paraburkholderia franconis]|uniref:ACT domain-containing protein n=1 Tax=Paraburkholderia franconis TaxID=2654983 RepID=UPI001D106338|nr:ACT domain-containing protein [Paraburkholderia franconis]